MAVAPFRVPLRSEYHENKSMEVKPPRKKRVFVQTETGCVVGIELDTRDNAHTVKRRLQLAFNVPTEESLLVYGDIVLKNDLSTVRNDSPLLLTRNYLHRSSSTPCLSPIGQDLAQGDESVPVEILGCSTIFSGTKQLVKDIVMAIEMGVNPIPVGSGLGGAYYFRNCNGENVAIVKPTDEEPFAPNNPKGFVGKALGQPGLKRSVRLGETCFREVAAYLLDYDQFANVPPTALVKITHSIFNVNDGVSGKKYQTMMQVSKIASFQQFIPHDFDASDHGTSSFPVSSVHRIGILDVRILNTDRHAGNLLVKKLDQVGRFGQLELVPIDHGLCLPESLEDPYFEWIHWPQASFPFSEDELEYIHHLDPFRDCDMLRMELPLIREACLRVLVLCTIFLKEAATFGFCLAEIGEMMSREFQGHDEEPSELEIICIQARNLLERETPNSKEEMQFDMDCEQMELILNMKKKTANNLPSHFGSKGGNGRHLLSELVRTVNLGEKSWRHQAKMANGGYTSGNRSVDEQLPASACFVKLGDMSEEEWVIFLKNFQKLLLPSFMGRKSGSSGSRQRQRLGTSCQF